MSTVAHPLNFKVLIDTFPDDVTMPAFMVSTTRGFLPRDDPVVTLPSDFDALESLLARMPITTASGQPGLLAAGKLGDTVLQELPDLSTAIEKHRANLPLMNALYRDYSFLASAYMLEPCHLQQVKDGTYGLARDRLPKNIAVPIAKVAEMYVQVRVNRTFWSNIAVTVQGLSLSWSTLARTRS